MKADAAQQDKLCCTIDRSQTQTSATEFFFPVLLFGNFFTALLLMTKIYPQLRLTSLIFDV